jgi:hypothetical protein
MHASAVVTAQFVIYKHALARERTMQHASNYVPHADAESEGSTPVSEEASKATDTTPPAISYLRPYSKKKKTGLRNLMIQIWHC